MIPPDQSESFVRQLTENQNRLYGYIFSLLGDHSRASDVLQETNLVLWRKIDEFRPDSPFLPWAFGIARYQVLAQLRDQSRDRMLLDAELAESMSAEAERQSGQLEQSRDALRLCLQTLSDENRQLIDLRYHKVHSVADLAKAVDRTVSAVKVALLRARRQLADCVNKRLAAEG